MESLDLITASILSKKLAEGLDSLVMDVKVGNGAFMPTYELSRALAQSIAQVATQAGCQTTALLWGSDYFDTIDGVAGISLNATTVNALGLVEPRKWL